MTGTGNGVPGTIVSGGGAAVVQRLMRPRRLPAPGEACELCGETIAPTHSHLADIAQRRLVCSCRGCYLLFTADGAGGKTLRAVPDTIRRLDLALSDEEWRSLDVPVDVMFLFDQTALDAAWGPVAYYPSPGGATESLFDLHAWATLCDRHPALANRLPDVEAILLRRHDSGVAAYLVPIDVCYELVGGVRTVWTGINGGPEVQGVLQEFFAALDLGRRPQ